MSHSRPWISDEKKTVLIYSPKAACTTLHHWFIKELCEIDDDRDPRKIANENSFIKEYNCIKPNYNIYFFIRDPIKRCISCFINKFIIYIGIRLSKDNLEKFSNKLLENYEITYETLTFNRFLSAIQYGMWIKKINMHFNNQVCERNFNKIKEMNPNINMTGDIKKVLNLDYKLNNSQISNNTENYKDITNMLVTSINLEDLKYNNFSSSFDRIKDIYKIDYKFIENYIN
jgi:hypothetical protein